MINLPTDYDRELPQRRFAVVYTPRRQRSRFPENCVQLKETREDAVTGGDPQGNHYPALVYGPSRSSEGIRLFYLLEWLGK